MALEITRGLFGLEIPESSDQDFKDAVTFAQLTPEQSVRASAMMSGQMLGRGVGQVLGAAAGGFAGIDTRDPDAKRRSAGIRALQEVQSRGINPDDPEAYLPVIAKAFQDEGLLEDALKAATALQAHRQSKMKLGIDQQEATAKLMGAQAELLKAGTGAAKEKREGSVENRIQELARTGKFTPASLAAYEKSGNINDLAMDGRKVQKVETKDGVYLVPEDSMWDQSTWVRVGDPIRAAGSSQDRESAAAKLQSLMTKHRKSDELDADMISRLSEGNPEERNDAAMMRALAAAAVGTDHAGRVLGEGEKLTEGEQQLFGYAKAAEFASKIYRGNWEGKELPDVSAVKGALQKIADSDPKAPMTLQFLLTLSPDPAVRRYLGDAFGVLLPVLRKDTGAAIAASEWINYMNSYVGLSNDLPEARRDKDKRLNERIIGMRALVSSPKYRMYTKRYDEMMAAEGAKTSNIDALLEGAKAVAGKDEATRKKFWDSLTPQEKKLLEPYLKR